MTESQMRNTPLTSDGKVKVRDKEEEEEGEGEGEEVGTNEGAPVDPMAEDR